MDEYLFPAKLAAYEKKKKRFLIAGGILTALFVFGVLSAVFDVKTSDGSSLRDGLLTYVVCLIPSVILLICGFRMKKNIELAQQYNTIFMCDEDGFVDASELAAQTGKPLTKVFQELETLFRKGLFQNCTLQKSGKPGVVLGNKRIRDENSQGFVVVKCASCGGTSRIRSGMSGRCEYCGSEIRA